MYTHLKQHEYECSCIQMVLAYESKYDQIWTCAYWHTKVCKYTGCVYMAMFRMCTSLKGWDTYVYMPCRHGVMDKGYNHPTRQIHEKKEYKTDTIISYYFYFLSLHAFVMYLICLFFLI